MEPYWERRYCQLVSLGSSTLTEVCGPPVGRPYQCRLNPLELHSNGLITYKYKATFFLSEEK